VKLLDGEQTLRGFRQTREAMPQLIVEPDIPWTK
jgi:hypothetical protein